MESTTFSRCLPPPAPRALRRAAALLAAVALAAASPAPVARAEEPTADAQARAKELYENGAELYAEGRYEDAIVAWREGYALTQLPDFLYNIAGAQERIGDLQGALDTLGRYRAFAAATERESLARRIRALEDRLEQQRQVAPQPTPVPQPAPQPAPVPAPAPTPAHRSSIRPILGATFLGLGAVGYGVGVGSGLGAASAGREAERSCVDAGASLLCGAGAAQPIRQQRSRAVVADVGYAVGTALAATGVVVFALGSGDGGQASVSVAPGGVALTVRR